MEITKYLIREVRTRLSEVVIVLASFLAADSSAADESCSGPIPNSETPISESGQGCRSTIWFCGSGLDHVVPIAVALTKYMCKKVGGLHQR